jgi:hypothetical protein
MKRREVVQVTVQESFLLSKMVSDPETFARTPFTASLSDLQICWLSGYESSREAKFEVNIRGRWTKRLQAAMPKATGLWLTLRHLWICYVAFLTDGSAPATTSTFSEWLILRNKENHSLHDISIHLALDCSGDSEVQELFAVLAKELSQLP